MGYSQSNSQMKFFLAVKAYIKKEARSQIHNLNLRTQKEKNKLNPKLGEGEKIMKIQMEIKKNTEWKIIVSTNPKVGFLKTKLTKLQLDGQK